MQKKVLKQHFIDFPPTEFWRLFIDANRAAVGPLGFDEREPGYLKGLQNAFNFALANIDKPLTADFIIQLHDESVKNVKTYLTYTDNESEEPKYLEQNFELGLRDSLADFGLVVTGENKNATRAGLAGLLEKMAKGEKFTLTIQNPAETAFIRSNNIIRPITTQAVDQLYARLVNPDVTLASLAITTSPEELKSKINSLINDFNEAISTAEQEDQKLLAIATFINALELDHSFRDGNCRTFVLELLPIVLMQQGFPPSIVTNPNRFDLFSPAELVTEIREGFARFQSIKSSVPLPVAGHEADTLLYINETTATLLAFAAVKTIPHWNEVNPSEQDYAVELIKRALTTGFAKKALTFEEVVPTVATLKSAVQEAVYQKSFYQLTIFNRPNNYGIYFSSSLNALLNHPSLSVDSLVSKLNPKPAVPQP